MYETFKMPWGWGRGQCCSKGRHDGSKRGWDQLGWWEEPRQQGGAQFHKWVFLLCQVSNPSHPVGSEREARKGVSCGNWN